MIERYFFQGAKYAWAPPAPITNAPKDGAIVISPPTPSALSFVDLDPYLFDTRNANKFRSLGLAKNQAITHDWLCYIHGRTAQINSNNDVLTGFMSGCFIAVWTDGLGARQVGHIGTVESAPKNQPPNSTVKNTFSAAMPNNVKAYNPADAWNFSEIQALTTKYQNPPYDGWWKVMSLVTSNNQFFSILLLKQRQIDTQISCAGIKPCAGMGFNLLQQALA
jgi:hypothetical protein